MQRLTLSAFYGVFTGAGGRSYAKQLIGIVTFYLYYYPEM